MATDIIKPVGKYAVKPALPAKPDIAVHKLLEKNPSLTCGSKPPIPPKRSSSKALDRKKRASRTSDRNLPPDGSILGKIDVSTNQGRNKGENEMHTTTKLEQDFFTPGSKNGKSHKCGRHVVDEKSRNRHVDAGNHVTSPGDGQVNGDVKDAIISEMPPQTKVADTKESVLPEKPVINVKLVKGQAKPGRSNSRASQSPNVLNKPTEQVYSAVSDLHDLHHLGEFRRMGTRSSFLAENADPAEQQHPPDGIYERVGDVQTLLKHSKKEDEHTYSLPQPQCYSDSTMKAVKVITEKYDTLQRMRQHAMSFRTGTKPRSYGNSPTREKAPVEAQSDSKGPEQIPIPAEDLAAAPVSSEQTDHSVTLCADESSLSRREVCRLEMFYGSHAAQVVVCRCAADLTCGQKDTHFDTWKHLASGIPVLVLNTGMGKRPRQLLLVLADSRTGFPVWDDKITYLTNYTEERADFHTLRLSRNLTKMAGLQMSCSEAGEMFMACFRELTSDPNDDLWKVSAGGNRRKGPKKKKKGKLMKKTDISQPINFFHITNVALMNEDSMRQLFDLAQTKETAGVVQKDRTSISET